MLWAMWSAKRGLAIACRLSVCLSLRMTPTVATLVQLAIKHPVPDRVKLSFVIFDIWALWRSAPERQIWAQLLENKMRVMWRWWKFHDRSSRFDTIPDCHVRTDRGTRTSRARARAIISYTPCPENAPEQNAVTCTVYNAIQQHLHSII